MENMEQLHIGPFTFQSTEWGGLLVMLSPEDKYELDPQQAAALRRYLLAAWDKQRAATSLTIREVVYYRRLAQRAGE